MRLTRAGETPSRTVNPDWYTGTVWTTELAAGEAPHRLRVVLATFLPGARTAWHTHPFGQILVATSGTGRVQLAGGPVQVLNPGDSVTIAPGERHWHGAGPDQVFAHTSMQGATEDGTMADWSDPVTDQEYGQPPSDSNAALRGGPDRRSRMAYQSVNPFTEEVIETFPDHTDAELERILAAADAAYRADWRLRSHADRAAVVRKAAAILRERAGYFAAIATREMGKLLREAKEEVLLSADILDYYADNAAALLAARPLSLARGEAVVESQPIGVIFAIEPWNFPYYQLARVAGPNLMAGNTLIVKHAPGVPRCALEFAALFPAAAGKALKKSTMELGGSDAFIVLDDADLDVAVRLAVQGRMNNMGQACAGSKRFIMHDAVADAFRSWPMCARTTLPSGRSSSRQSP